MTSINYPEAIANLARDVFKAPGETFDPTRRFRDIPGFDSILAIQYILTVESTFGITLGEEEVDNMHTMGALLEYVQAKSQG